MSRIIATESYEMKLFLKPFIFDKVNDVIKPEYVNEFNLSSNTSVLCTQYIDTAERDIDKSKFNIRVRKKNTSSNTEITFKKRFPSLCCVEEGLVIAAEEGFDATNTVYECEADCGYISKTLSFSNESKCKLNYSDPFKLPTLDKSVELVEQYAPQEVAQLLIGKEFKIYGPVYITRYEGTVCGYPIRVEVMPVKATYGDGEEYIVELSFKTDDKKFAYAFHGVLKNIVNDLGILKDEDVLKTQIVLDRH